MPHIWMSHVALKWMSHVTYMNGSCLWNISYEIMLAYKWVMCHTHTHKHKHTNTDTQIHRHTDANTPGLGRRGTHVCTSKKIYIYINIHTNIMTSNLSLSWAFARMHISTHLVWGAEPLMLRKNNHVFEEILCYSHQWVTSYIYEYATSHIWGGYD